MSILDSIAQVLGTSPIGNPGTTGAQTISQGLYSSANGVSKHSVKPTSMTGDCHGSANTSEQATPSALDLSSQTDLFVPMVTPMPPMLVQNTYMESSASSALSVGSGTENQSQAPQISQAPESGAITAPSISTDASYGVVATAEISNSVASLAEAQTRTTDGTAITTDLATPAANTATAGVGQIELATTDLVDQPLAASSSAISPKQAPTNVPVPPTVPGSVQAPEEQESTHVRSANKGEAAEKQTVADNVSLKPEQPNEALSAQARRVSENPLNLSKTRTAVKTEITNLSPLKDLPEVIAPVSSNAIATTGSSSQDLNTQSVASPGEKLAPGTQTSSSLHQNADGTGNPKSQSDKEASFSTTNGNAIESGVSAGMSQATESLPGGSSSSTVAVAQAAVLAGDGKNAAANLPAKTASATAEHSDQTSSAAVESHSSMNTPIYPGSVLSSAKLVERLGESELRLGIRAGELGSVDIRTTMVRNQFTAEISVERGELGRALAAELPSLQNRLSEQRIPVASIVLQNQTGGNAGTPEQQRPRQEQAMPAPSYSGAREEGPASLSTVTSGADEQGSRLDVHL